MMQARKLRIPEDTHVRQAAIISEYQPDLRPGGNEPILFFRRSVSDVIQDAFREEYDDLGRQIVTVSDIIQVEGESIPNDGLHNIFHDLIVADRNYRTNSGDYRTLGDLADDNNIPLVYTKTLGVYVPSKLEERLREYRVDHKKKQLA